MKAKTMRLYAAQTSVTPEKSRVEIETILKRYGADQFAYGWMETGAMIGFRFNKWMVRFTIPIPSMEDAKKTPRGRRRYSQSGILQAWEQDKRRRWRSLALAIKAKLDTVATGITTFETEFLPYIVLPGGKTAGERMVPELEEIYRTGNVPPLLTAGGSPEEA